MFRRSPLPTSHSAFTLIEVVTVIVVLAITSGLLATSYSGFAAHSRFKGAVADAADACRLAHEQAIALDRTVLLTITPAERKLEVVVPQDLATPEETDLPSSWQPQPVQPATSQSLQTGQSALPVPPPRDTRLSPEFTISAASSEDRAAAAPSARTVLFRGDGTCDGLELTVTSVEGYHATVLVWPASSRVTVNEQ
ncbi:MAG TPA: type II secretion system protein [Chthonomonadales bacterium]|nr:type II secretion system protein [Chthonomonadales bacterium]